MTQPLLRGADPAVSAEPLRDARRAVDTQGRSLEVLRRRTVLLIYQLYLGLARQQEAVRLAADQMERARGGWPSFPRLASWRAACRGWTFCARSSSWLLPRSTATTPKTWPTICGISSGAPPGSPPSSSSRIRPPEEIPDTEPDLDTALSGLGSRRPEAVEAQELVHDSRLNVRIARSLELPSLDAVISYEAVGSGRNVGDALPPRNGVFLFGFRTQYGLNYTPLYAARRSAEVQLESRRRNLGILEDDLVREVRRAYRRLDALSKNLAIATENLRVAQLQVEVARLRFEKGLSDNFNVVDAENLLNSALLLELDSRFALLLARLDCLYASGAMPVEAFRSQP